MIGRLLGAATVGTAGVLHAGPALAPVLPGLGEALGIEMRRPGSEGVAITFDDGPHPQGTPRVLEILREAGAPATFFLAGEQVERRPALAAEIVAAGHRVELHCHRHRNQLRLTPRALLDDAERGRAAIEEASGQEIHDYRPPYGIFSASGLARDQAAGLAARALVAVGSGLEGKRDPRVDREAGHGRCRGRRHPATSRCRLLQRARLLGTDRRGAAGHTR